MLKYPEYDHYEKTYKRAATFLKRWNGGTVIMTELTISHPTLILKIYKKGNEGCLKLACIDPQWIQGQRMWENCEIELEAKVKLKSGEIGYIISDKKAEMNIHCAAFESSEYLTKENKQLNEMKTQIQSAQIVVPCVKFDESLEFFTETLGFRVEMIFPADAPVVAVISGFGTTLRLEKSSEIQSLTVRLTGDFGASAGEISSPDGVRVILANVSRAVEIPAMTQKLIVSALDGDDVWGAGRAGMQYRDLIPGRLGGRFVASHIRIPVGGEVPDYVHFHKVRFQMIYCISGWAKLVYENQGEPFVMNAGDCVLQPPEIRHRVLESSDQFEVLEIGCPAIHETYADHQMPLPNETLAPEKIYADQRFLHHIAEKSVWKQSPFEKIESRDTGIFAATGGLADVQILRANDETNFSVNHSDEFLFFFILKGELKLDSADQTYQLKTGGSFVLPNDAEFQISVGRELEMIQIKLSAE